MATAAIERPLFPQLAGLYGECLGEFLGTMVLILFGDGCVVGTLVYGIGYNTPLWVNWMIIAWGWGLAVVMGVYVAGTLSGAHINPAVTLAFAARGKFPWNKVGPYWISQVAGAFIAALLLWVVYHGAYIHYETLHHISRGCNDYNTTQTCVLEAKTFYTFKQPFVGIGGAFGDQVIGTALLVGLIFAIVDLINSPPQSNLAPFIIGLVVVAIGLSFGYNAGYAINPARDFGPRLAALAVGFRGIAMPGPDNYFWVPILGPLVGGVLGAFVYDYTVHQALLAHGVGPSGEAVESGVTEVAPERAAPGVETGRTVREP
jgi:glycerol uptake facilitator protein